MMGNSDLKIKIDDYQYMPLRDVVFHTLREAILRGDLAPGERLMEIKLADQMGVSRTPIREAIRMLELEGLVVMLPRRGAQVAKITEKDMRDVLEVRVGLEELAVRLACERITQEELAQLEEASREFEKQVATVKKGDITALAEADVKFHEVIYRATNNQRLVQLINNVKEQIYRYRIECLKDRAGWTGLIEEHQAICEALKQKDVEKANKYTVDHIKRQEDTIMKIGKTDKIAE